MTMTMTMMHTYPSTVLPIAGQEVADDNFHHLTKQKNKIKNKNKNKNKSKNKSKSKNKNKSKSKSKNKK